MESLSTEIILNALVIGGAIYGGIRVEIRCLWRDVRKAEDRITRLEKSN